MASACIAYSLRRPTVLNENIWINWCRRVELNHWPRPYQGRALPLSYGGSPDAPYAIGVYCAQDDEAVASCGETRYGCVGSKLRCDYEFDRAFAMPDNPAKPAPRMSAKGRQLQAEREQRRAELLRRNLLKRKVQQRGRSGDGEAKGN